MDARFDTGISRREFLAVSAVAAVAASTGQAASPETQKSTGSGLCLCMFSKYLQSRNCTQLGEALRELGFANVDLTVRAAGHVLPERVAEDLPKACEDLKRSGVRVAMITTEITSADQPHAEATIAAAASLGIRYLKLGYYYYRDLTAIPRTFTEIRSKLQGLVPMLKQYGVQAGFHNHCGVQAGALMWDEWELIRDLDPQWVGAYIDPCHAVIEGGAGGWQIGMNLLAPRLKMVAVKDFIWGGEAGKRKPVIVGLSGGTVPWPGVWKIVKAAYFTGPISMHLEYGEQGKPGSDAEKALFAAIRNDSRILREQLATAGLTLS